MTKYLSIIIFGIVTSIGYCLDEATTNILSIKDIIARLEDANSFHSKDSVKTMISQLGDSGDKAAIPVLQRYLVKSNSRHPKTIGGYAQVALAKLGDDNAFNEIIQEAKTNNVVIYQNSFIKLRMVGNDKAINILGQYLFVDESPPHEIPPEKGADGRTRQDVVRFGRPSYWAARTLGMIFQNKSPTSTKPDFYTNNDIQKWREWWQANSNKFCEPSSNEVTKAKTP